MARGGSGTIDFGSAGGGTLTTGSLFFADSAQFSGKGTILARGIGTNGDRVLEGPQGAMWTEHWTGPNQDIHATFDLSGAGGTGDMTVGYYGQGSMALRDGVHVAARSAYIGYGTGAQGAVSVTGSGTRWDIDSIFSLGQGGSGDLTISGGARVKAQFVQLSSGVLTLSVGDGSVLETPIVFATGGTVRLVAAPTALSGAAYTPVQYSINNYTGPGYIQTLSSVVQAIGGRWNASTSVFTPSTVATADAGTPVNIDLAQTQRVMITDGTSGDRVLASFLSEASTTPVTFAATPLTGDEAALLQAALTDGARVLDGWTFAETGVLSGDPVYLSLDVGPGATRDSMEVWHFDGTTWTPFDASDLSYDGTFASFTVTGFSGYAVTGLVTGTVPEPASLGLLALGAIALLRRRR